MNFNEQRCFTFETIKAPKPQDKVYDDEGSKPMVYDTDCQTVYRESEAQTVPWTPPYRVLQCRTPEVLTLACLSFHNGLLVTTHDVDILLRLRKKREWERYLAHIYSPYNEEYRLKIITELEKNEWEYREKEIEDINELRMELAQKQMLEQRMIIQERMDYRIKRAREKYEMEKSVKLPKISAECDREIRRIHVMHAGLNKFKKRDIIDRFTHLSSDLYAPLAIFGKNPADRHEKLCIDPQPKVIGDIYSALWKGISTTPVLPKMNGRHLKKHCCKRLKFYHMPEEVPAKQIEHYDRLKNKVEKGLNAPLACTLGERDEEEEEILRNVVLLQSIIKGRAVQCMVLRHMKPLRDLVRELKSTVGLNHIDRIKKLRMRRDILMGIRDFNIALHKKGQIIGLIEMLEGHTVSTMLDYTSKALLRLEDEKRVHLFALAAEKERWARESTEAGRRQQEEIRQQMHEEIYKQILKMHEISSDVLLEETVEKQLKDTSKALATLWAKKHAKDVDDIRDVSQLEEFEKMEYITKMSSQFVMDEVEKKQIRAEMKARTAVLRKYAEAVIYNKQSEFIEAESSSDISAISNMRKMCKQEKDEEEKEWDKFYGEILDNSPEVRQVLTGEMDKIPLYEDPLLVKSLMEGDQEDDAKSDQDKPQDHEQKTKKTQKRQSTKINQENQSSHSEITSSGTSEVGKPGVAAESNVDEFASMYDIMDWDEAKFINDFISDPKTSVTESSLKSEESSETEFTSEELEDAEKRRETYNQEEKNRFFKCLAQKILEQIIARANAIAKKVRELAEGSVEMSTNQACAEALINAYKIVSKALLNCCENFTESALKECLEPWLDTILTEAEKRIYELYDALMEGVEVAEEPKEIHEENKEEDLKNLIEEVTGPSQERLPLIPAATSGFHIFKGPLYWCPDMELIEKVKPETLETKIKSETFTDEELKRLKYEGLLLEKKLSYLPDETHLKKPLAVIKSRRGPYEEGNDDCNL